MIPPFFHLFSTVWLHLFSFNILKINNGLNNNDSVDFFPLVYVLRKNQRLKSFYCYWQCWYFLLFRIQFNHDQKKRNQNTHNKSFVTHLHKATIIYHFIEWNMYDAHTKHAQTWWWVALLRRGQFCLFAKLKKKSYIFNSSRIEASQYQNTSFRYEGWICIRLVICWGVFNSVLLLSLKQLNLLMLFDIFYSVWFLFFFCVFFKIRRILNKASPLFGFFLSSNRVDFEYVTEAAILPHTNILIRSKSCEKKLEFENKADVSEEKHANDQKSLWITIAMEQWGFLDETTRNLYTFNGTRGSPEGSLLQPSKGWTQKWQIIFGYLSILWAAVGSLSQLINKIPLFVSSFHSCCQQTNDCLRKALWSHRK